MKLLLTIDTFAVVLRDVGYWERLQRPFLVTKLCSLLLPVKSNDQ